MIKPNSFSFLFYITIILRRLQTFTCIMQMIISFKNTKKKQEKNIPLSFETHRSLPLRATNPKIFYIQKWYGQTVEGLARESTFSKSSNTPKSYVTTPLTWLRESTDKSFEKK